MGYEIRAISACYMWKLMARLRLYEATDPVCVCVCSSTQNARVCQVKTEKMKDLKDFRVFAVA